MTLFDTDVLVWALRGNAKAVAAIDDASERAVSAVSYMELLRGARDARDGAAIRRFLRLGGFRVYPVTEAVTSRAVALMEALALSDRLDPMDALIFGTALEAGLVLCSANQKHFKNIEGLQSIVFRP